MEKLFIAFVFIVSHLIASAQDSVLLSPKWQQVFSDASRLEYISLELADFDKKFQRGELYDGLIIFKDSAKQSLEINIMYSGIIDLCDINKPIRGKNLRTPRGYEISKKDVLYFVFHDLIFALDVTRKEYAVSFSDNKYWSVLLVDGPVRFTKGYYLNKMSSGSVLEIDAGRIQKGETPIGSDPDIFGGFNFKKFAVKTFSDYKELADKIVAEQEGYKKKDALKIMLEYNDWVKRENPDAFRESLLMKAFLNNKN